jgi:hypothetical protein
MGELSLKQQGRYLFAQLWTASQEMRLRELNLIGPREKQQTVWDQKVTAVCLIEWPLLQATKQIKTPNFKLKCKVMHMSLTWIVYKRPQKFRNKEL